ncbi:hypothetical protein CLOP_g22099 [Closterium sp. NIES-67]|nr:hypothetical protein CLOP_g22099 [Closterium sp. NIES-67]
MIYSQRRSTKGTARPDVRRRCWVRRQRRSNRRGTRWETGRGPVRRRKHGSVDRKGRRRRGRRRRATEACMCIDYRALNNQTIKNKYPIHESMTCLTSFREPRYVPNEYAVRIWQIRMADNSIHKLPSEFGTGHTRIRNAVGLTNAPATFQAEMNHILRPLLDECVVVYLDDILIYSCACSSTSHTCDASSTFSDENNSMSNHPRANSPRESPIPRTHVRKIATPLTNLLKKNTPCTWEPKHQEVVEQLKQALTSTPILILPDPERDYVIEADASDQAWSSLNARPGEWTATNCLSQQETTRAEQTTDTRQGALAISSPSKLSRKKTGPLQPQPVPEQPWQVVSLDFITGLPITTSGHDAILVTINKFSKMIHFIPTHTTARTEETAQLFVCYIFSQHGIPTTLISDRDPKFTSKFWKELMSLLGPNSPCHPPTIRRQMDRPST